MEESDGWNVPAVRTTSNFRYNRLRGLLRPQALPFFPLFCHSLLSRSTSSVSLELTYTLAKASKHPRPPLPSPSPYHTPIQPRLASSHSSHGECSAAGL